MVIGVGLRVSTYIKGIPQRGFSVHVLQCMWRLPVVSASPFAQSGSLITGCVEMVTESGVGANTPVSNGVLHLSPPNPLVAYTLGVGK